MYETPIKGSVSSRLSFTATAQKVSEGVSAVSGRVLKGPLFLL